jgi:hypothetical protein
MQYSREREPGAGEMTIGTDDRRGGCSGASSLSFVRRRRAG